MTMVKKTLEQVLIERRLVTEEQIAEAKEAAASVSPPLPLSSMLVDLGYVEEVQVLKVESELLGVPAVDLNNFEIPDKVMPLIPRELQQRYRCLPLRLDGRRLSVAMSDPKNVFAVDDLRTVTGYDIRPVLASASAIDSKGNFSAEGGADAAKGGGGDEAGGMGLADINSAIAAMGGGGDIPEELRADSETAGIKELVEEAPIIRIVNAIIHQAIKDGASDIHVEPQLRNLRVRYRIDGVLHEVMKMPRHIQNPLLSRIKIMADMNIAERRVPQDGRIHIRMKGGKDFDLRVSTCPSTYGEKAVARILDKSSVMIGLDNLGLLPDIQAMLEKLCKQPNGMVLSTGPTGSGKTTTQYSVMNIINSVEKNIMTIEDPVEYQLPGLTQVHVNRKAGLTFANALKAFVRQDPDIIMVGEIRDLETAEIAIQASLTGHLVLSTLHTNDAPSAVTRLVDMGVEPFLISASVIGVLAQRLARRICSQCKEPYDPPVEALQVFGYDPDRDRDVVYYKGKGCENCRYTGYKGRLGIYEMMEVNEEIADLVVRRAPVSEIKQAAIANGMSTLQQDGYVKICMGMTTIEDVMRVVFTAGH